MDWFTRFAHFVSVCVCFASGWQLPALAQGGGPQVGSVLLAEDPVPGSAYNSPIPVPASLLSEPGNAPPPFVSPVAGHSVRQVANLSLPVENPLEFEYDVWSQAGVQPVLESGIPIDGGLLQGEVKIPTEILSARSRKKTKSTDKKSDKLPIVLRPDMSTDANGNEAMVGELDNATFNTELEILESQWNVDFKMGMQETSEDSNRVRLGTIARYRTPEQLLKIDMDFERSQGQEEQVANRLRLGTLARYRWKGKELEVDMKYERRQDEQENVTNRVLFDGTHEWCFSASHWSHYLGGKVEYDQLEESGSRFETNTGFSYSLLKNKSSHVKVKAGTMVSREIGLEEDEQAELLPESLYGLSVKQNVTDAQKLSTSVDYIPAWNDFQQYEVKAQANWQIILDQESDFRLKIGARNRYDSSMPIESLEEGIDYTTSLMWVY